MAVKKRPVIKAVGALLWLLLLCVISPALESSVDDDIFNLSIGDLLNVEVMSVTRSRGQSLFEAPTAIYVITPEEIENTGHIHLAEAMRLVPGMHVARIEAGDWAVCARGDNSRYNSRMLVQMDGRTLYNPIFGGVYWSVQDYVLDDIDRIEVIRGPGGTLWGANAVNGIVNIVTKEARDTQGLLLNFGAGGAESAFNSFRYGSSYDGDVYYRVYGKFKNTDNFPSTIDDFDYYRDIFPAVPADTPPYDDRSRLGMGGFRLDWDVDSDDRLTLQSDIYNAADGDSMAYAQVAEAYDPASGRTFYYGRSESAVKFEDGWNILSRWTRNMDDDNRLQLQVYYDYNRLEQKNSNINHQEDRRIFDMDFHHNFSPGRRHSAVWGLQYRSTEVDTGPGSSYINFADPNRLDETISGFVQDTLQLSRRLDLTLGSKAEKNDVTGTEIQPGGRLAYRIDEDNFLWGSVSRAVKVPAMATTNFNLRIKSLPNSDLAASRPFDIVMSPSPLVFPEKVVAYEIGYRTKPSKKWNFDVAAFYNDFENVQEIVTGAAATYNPMGGAGETQPATVHLVNRGDSDSYGLEIIANYVTNGRWDLTGTYTLFQSDPEDTSLPRNQASLRSHYLLDGNWTLNTALYYYDNIKLHGTNPADVMRWDEGAPAFFRLDLGLVWQPDSGGLQIGLWGQNLLDNSHREYNPDHYTSNGVSWIERSCYLAIEIGY